jgi:GT2 family glycosyltransferase
MISTNGPFIHYESNNKPLPTIIYDRVAAEAGGNRDQEKAIAHTRDPFIVIRTGANLGYAGGNNVGLRFAEKRGDYDYVWILNNDTIVHREALKELISCAENHKVGAAGSKLFYHDRPDTLHMAGGCRIVPWMGNASMIGVNQRDGEKWDRSLAPDYISGASLLVKKEVLENVGLMDEQYFLYWEDADWGIRMRKRGYGLLYCYRSTVWHKEGGTVGGITPQSDYYWVRNGLIFMKKFYPILLPLAFFSYFMKYTFVRFLKKQPSHFSAFLSGVRDFLRGKAGSI